MSVWLVILAVLLGLLLILLLVCLVLLNVRVGLDAVGVNGEISVELHYGWLRIPVWPPPRHLKKQPSGQQEDTYQPRRRKKKKYRYRVNREELDFGELTDLTRRLHSELTDLIRVSRLRIRVLIGTDDAAKTGMLLGTSAALTGMIVPFLENTFDMRDYHVNVDADFEADHTEWAFAVFGSLRPLQVLWCLLRHSGEAYRMYKRMIKKEEAIQHE